MANAQLVKVLREARELLSRPDNDFGWSSWNSASDALREIDDLIARIEAHAITPRQTLEILFLPAGPIQEVSVSSGWGKEFLALAERFDTAIRAL